MNSESSADHARQALREMLDEASYKMIESLSLHPKSAFQIASATGVPLTTTYRKIKKLRQLGLVSIERIDLDEKGKKLLMYKSRVRVTRFDVKPESVMMALEMTGPCLQFRLL
jgi:DNA-binding transcriptional ArsR family regulator